MTETGTSDSIGLRVVHLSFYPAPADRDPGRLIDQWRLLDVPQALASRGVDVCWLISGATEYRRVQDGVCIRFVAERGRRVTLSGGLFPPRNLVRVALEGPVDVLHVHGLHHASQLVYLARHVGGLRGADRARRVPIVVQDHANLPPGDRVRRALHRYALGLASTVTFTDLGLAEAFIEAGVLRRDARLRAVLEGSSAFKPGSQSEAQSHSGIDGSPCCLWAGDLDANKDPLTVLRGFLSVLEKFPDAKLWMCFRQSPLIDAVKDFIQRHPSLRDRVGLLGSKPHGEMEALHRAADFYLSASHREGGAYAAIEALACGAVPIVTDIPAFRRITLDGVEGGLFEPGDAEGLCRRLLEWTPRLSDERRQHAREHFERSLSLDVIAEGLIEIYQEAMI